MPVQSRLTVSFQKGKKKEDSDNDCVVLNINLLCCFKRSSLSYTCIKCVLLYVVVCVCLVHTYRFCTFYMYVHVCDSIMSHWNACLATCTVHVHVYVCVHFSV